MYVPQLHKACTGVMMLAVLYLMSRMFFYSHLEEHQNLKSLARQKRGASWIPNECNNVTVVTYASSGMLHPAMFPRGYTAGVCRWAIRAMRGKVIKIDFDFISFSCIHQDELRIEERERGVRYVHLDNVCGTIKPDSFTSFSYTLDVIFTAAHSTTRRAGFYLKFTAIPARNVYAAAPCVHPGIHVVVNDTLAVDSNSILSGSPANYNHLIDCGWRLSTGNFSRILYLEFEYFELEPRQRDVYDWLDIYDGADMSARKIGRYSGKDIIPPLKSSAQDLFIHFTSDETISAKGFTFHCTAQEIDTISDEWVPGCDGMVQDHSGVTGRLRFPQYGCMYYAMMECSFRISTSPGTVVQIGILVDIEPSPGCVFDWVILYDGPDTSSPRLSDRLCGRMTPHTAHTTSNQLLITFYSDLTRLFAGFRLSWHEKAEGDLIQGDACSPVGQILASPAGAVSSYNLQRSSPCIWHIQAPEGGAVLLEWHVLVIEDSYCPASVSVKVYDGSNTMQDPLMRTYCGNHVGTPAALKSSGRNLTVLLSDDGNDELFIYGTFRTYHAASAQDPGTAPGCSGEPQQLTAGSYELTSPAYDGVTPYGGHAQCAWKITASPGKNILITFRTVDLEDCVDCRADSVKVYRGTCKESANLVGERCGSSVNTNVSVNAREALVTFSTDHTVSGTGFQAVWQETDPVVCGLPDPAFPIFPKLYRMPTIMGGQEANPHSLPWQAQVYTSYGRMVGSCGGNILSPEWVLTAAHCLVRQNHARWESIMVTAGVHDTTDYRSSTWQAVTVSEAIIHPNYTECTFDSDMALLRLSKPLSFNNYVKAVCIPREPVAAGTDCLTSGWGRTRYDRDTSKVLLQVYVPIIKQSTCRNTYFFKSLTDGMMCAGGTGADACAGDSGGPLVCQSRTGAWHLHGVTSFGIKCDRGTTPGVYARVAYLLPWLRQHGAFTIA